MLEIRKTAIAFEEEGLMELEQIAADEDEKEALRFLKRSVYAKVARSLGPRLQSHLYGTGDPVDKFKSGGHP
jgi:hypothetical protein